MLVIDASVATKFLAREQGTDDARALLRSGESLIAPDWILAEVPNALFGKVKRRELSEQAVTNAITMLPDFFEALHPTAALLDTGYGLMFRLGHALYDCLYLALALREGGRLVTADAKFHQKVASSDMARHSMLLGQS